MSDAAKRHIFSMLDADGDGVISRDEYLARVDRAAEATGRDPLDPLVEAALAAHREVFGAMDADGDGRVGLDEYRGWAGHDAFEQSCRPALGSLFDLADADGDGHLTREEFTRLRAATGNTADGASAAFEVLDADGDGLVGRDAYLAAIHDYLTTGTSPMADAYRPSGPVPQEATAF
ncbi:EF-hand domain-containing protein [Kitasatospora purpeofusca]|uniref:EF-hand domain-containing protein n=1 Tax=Kitasatospora purpeofusca TaxID=67352 RepID=UPI002A5A24CE|nr:EF-hand domain-containing protein [Kitasatospora purpeofusca]MDY0815066.1 EF-hand domain-containing protein [Kitasatospora purpeofusca]